MQEWRNQDGDPKCQQCGNPARQLVGKYAPTPYKQHDKNSHKRLNLYTQLWEDLPTRRERGVFSPIGVENIGVRNNRGDLDA